MANPFFDPGNQRGAKVHELFARIAPRYDLINDLQSFWLHRYWKRRVIEVARPQPGDPALDVCCGTGDIALRLAAAGARVVGLDFSERMLEVAAGRTPPAAEVDEGGLPRSAGQVRWLRGDAQHLPFADGTFGAATIGYGLRNLASWRDGLSEMRRVVRPGGRLVVLDFGKPDNRHWRAVYFGYLRLFVPVLGRLFCGDAQAYAYILESLKHYPAQDGVAGCMREMGLVNVRVIYFLGGVMTINYGEKPADFAIERQGAGQ